MGHFPNFSILYSISLLSKCLKFLNDYLVGRSKIVTCFLLLYTSPRRGYMVTVHPPWSCSTGGGVRWFASYGRVHLLLHYDTKKDFELCLTSGSTNKVYVWWEKDPESWAPISFPVNYGALFF